ncbi:MAG: LytTR family DNA-binding domain-containing protein [Ferruginibacter sp.]
MIKAVAIDDEIPALQILNIFCSNSGIVQLEKTFNKPTEALKYLNQFPADLLFLDINMPALNGIELHKQLKQETMVIFTTAFSEFAVEGFNLNAVDYLLKPFSYERFLQAVQKAAQLRQYKTSATQQPEDNFIYIRADYKLIKINIADIIFIEGLDDYVKINLVHEKPITARLTLKALSDKLPADRLVRVHKSYIVALDKIKSVSTRIIQIDQEEIPIGSTYEENFLKYFNK